MEKKYQVFISSTYTDLIEERKKVIDILLMADCIPAGMEAFVATDSEQFEVIKRVIDLCDYYVLIIGRRYGSVNPEKGISYTEMEYEYAISKNIPVLVFALDNSVELPPEKTDTDVHMLAKLDDFRNKALNNRLASIWHSIDDLTGKVAISITKAKTEISRPGWQRGTDYDEGSLRRQIMSLQDENRMLRSDLANLEETVHSLTKQSDVQFENCRMKIQYEYNMENYLGKMDKKTGTITTDLKTLFLIIATEMMDVSVIEPVLMKALEAQLPLKGETPKLKDRQFVKRILNQFKALDLVYSRWDDDRRNLFWGLTIKGEKERDDQILIKNNKMTISNNKT